MTKENFEIALDFLFPAEGGYVNNKYDKGGATNMGITQYTYNNYKMKKGLPIENIKNINRNEVEDIYYNDYWKTSGADNISDVNMAVALFDTAVLHGPMTAKIFYNNSKGNINDFLKLRRQSYDKIVEKDPSQKIFYKGWNNRVNNLENSINSNKFKNIDKNKNITGFAASVYTPEQIGKMSIEEYMNNEEEILSQYEKGLIKNKEEEKDYSGYINPISGKNRVFTREDIDKMTTEEFIKHQEEILIQTEAIGVPYKDNLSKNTITYTKDKNYYSPKNGKWVTIDGNHVFIEND